MGRDAADRPNFILINCDDLGFGDLACFGSPVNKTPALDRMAAEGAKLTSFYMASSVCSPSRGAMMTGCYPARIGFERFPAKQPGHFSGVLFPGDSTGLHPDEITVADLLKQQGYATKIVGKWHCGDQPPFLPTRHGFDEYFGLPYSNDMGRQTGGKEWPPLPLMENETPIQLQPDQRGITERYVEHTVRFIREHRDEPFFLYLAHMHVHLPHYPPERFLRSSENGPYGGAVECIDWSVSVIMHELEQLGLDDNTVVVFTSDNGSRGDRGGSNGALRGNKGTTWEGGLRVPCIVRWPGKVAAGQTFDQITTSMDLLPTFTNLAGGKVPTDRKLDGMDLGPMLTGSMGASPREDFFYYRGGTLCATRRGPWKLHVRRGAESVRELYNLEEDLGEKQNVVDEHGDIEKELMGMLAACRAELGDLAEDVTGSGCRPIGMVDDPHPIAEHDPSHPYIIAMYDLPDRG